MLTNIRKIAKMPQEERNSTLAEAPTFFQLYSEVTPEILSFLAQESPFTNLDENLVGMGIGYKNGSALM